MTRSGRSRKVMFQSLELNQGPLTHEANAPPTELLWMLKNTQFTKIVIFSKSMIKVDFKVVASDWCAKVMLNQKMMQYLLGLIRHSKNRIQISHLTQ